MNRLRALLPKRSLLALAAACGLQCAWNAHAQLATPPAGKALVILYRNDRQPVAAKVPVIANADRLGEMGNREFVNAVVNPGRTFLRVGDRILTTLALQTAPNQRYFVLVEAVPNLTPVRVEMRETTEAAARNVLAQSRPIGAAPIAAAPSRAPVPAAVVPVPPVPAPRAPVAAAAAAPAAAAPKPAAAPPPPAQPRRFSTIAREPPPPQEEEDEEAELRKWRIAVIAKTGRFKLASTTQTIDNLASTYDASSKPVFGFEAEFRHQDGFAVGGELFYYKNDITSPGATFQGQQTVISGMLNGKYYFGGPDGVFHPFVGAGAGFAGAKFGGDISGKSGGPGFQGMLGADLRFGSSFGLYLEYKYLSSTTSAANNQKIKVSGSGLLAGVSIGF